MNTLLHHLETSSVAALKSRPVTQLLPCVYCSYERKWRNYSTLKGPKTQKLLQRDMPMCTQYSSVREEHYWSFAHHAMNGAQAYFEYVHAATGLDWWASLMVAVVPVRIALTCIISTLQSRNMKKVVYSHLMAMPELQKLKKNEFTPDRLSAIVAQYRAKSPEQIEAIQKNIHEEVQRQYAKRRCHPYKNFGYGLMTLPLWISGAFAIRNMTGSDIMPFLATYNAIPSFGTEGCLWFANLLAPDTTHILPILEWVMVQLTFEFSISQIGDNKTGWVKYYIYFIRCWQVWTTIFVWYLWNKPSGLIYYWVLTTTANLGTNMLLQAPKVRQLLGLHVTSKTPYRDMVKRTYDRYNIRQRLRDRKFRKRAEREQLRKG